MAVNVGGISIELDGDAAGAITALEAAGKKVEELKLKEKDLALALEAATKAGLTNENGLRALQDAHAAASSAVSKATGNVSSSAEHLHTSTTKGAAGLGTLKQAGDKLDGAMGPLQIAIGGIGSALGGTGQQAANMVGGLADVGMVVSKLGGPVGLAAAAFIALGVAAAKIYEISEESKAANRAWVASFDDVAKSLTSRFTAAITSTRDAIKELVKQTREAGREGAEILAEQALNEKKSVERSIETLTRNKGGQQAAFNAAEGAMRSAAAKGAVPEDVQNDFEMAKQIIDTTAKRLEILGEALVSAKQNVADADAAWVESAQKAADINAQQEKESKAKSSGDETQKRVADAEAKMADEVRSASYSMGSAAHALQAVGLGAAAFLASATERGGIIAPEPMAPIPDAYDEFISSLSEFDWGNMADESMKAARAVNAASEAFASAASDVAVATIQGGASGGGQALGSMAGSAIGMATGLDPTGAVGGALGGMIGGMLGETIDELMEAMGVFTPVFDAVAVVVQALQPIFLVLGEASTIVGDLLLQLAPIVMDLAAPISAIILILLRVVEAIMPFIGIIITLVHYFVVFLDIITMGAQWLDNHVFRILVEASRALYNGFVDAVNGIIKFIRLIPGFDKFGTLMNKVSVATTDLVDKFGEATVAAKHRGDADEKATEQAEDLSTYKATSANVPSGWKRSEFASAQSSMTAGGDTSVVYNLTIAEFVSKGSMSDDISDLKRIARNGHKGASAISRRFGDNKN